MTIMATSAESGWQPDWVVPPGEILLEALQDRDMTQSELAQRLGRPLKTVNEIIKGKAAITPETAIQLERALGTSASFWTNLETQYRDTLARQAAHADLESHATWADRFPIPDLVRHHLIERGPTKAETLANLLSWLGVSSPDAFDRLTAAAAYHASPAFSASPEAVAAWLRWGEVQAAPVKAAAFDPERFRQVLDDIRPLSRKAPFGGVFKQLQSMCAEAGVVVVLTPELTGTHLSGAARWIGAKALIQLSLRHKSDDQFWFTFFHEAGHLLTRKRRRDFIDGVDVTDPDTAADEQVANEFAREALVPSDEYERFVARGDFGTPAVRTFAESLSVSPGIVAGRLERDRHLTPAQARTHKQTIRYPTDRAL
jgi:HTH-type transcriptional regulator/antitoxin HigA